MNTAIALMLAIYVATLVLIGVTAFQMLSGRDRQPYPPKDKT